MLSRDSTEPASSQRGQLSIQSAAPSDRTRALLEGMPEAYYTRHGESEILAHAQIAARRSRAVVQLEPCPGPPQTEHAQWLCVVADDRPGLLSLLSAAISAHSLDILGARVYCRPRPGAANEAIDLFAVRGIKESAGLVLGKADLLAIRRSMEALLRGEIDVATLEKRATPTSRPLGEPPAVVFFEDRKDADVLVVEADDRPGLLLAISLTIFRERLSIVRSHITTFARTARDEFELAELDGSRLTAPRKTGVAEKVRQALEREGAPRGAKSTP